MQRSKYRRLPTHLALLAFALCALPVGARAHPTLRASTPARDATLLVAPSSIRLQFSESVELALTRVALNLVGGASVALGKATRPADSLGIVVVPIATTLANGSYKVTWRIVGTDGHPARGEFSFVVAVAARPASPAAPEALDGFDASSPLYAAVRFVRYSALLSLIGASWFVLGVLPRVADDARFDAGALTSAATGRARLVARWGAGALLVSSMLRLVAQVAAVDGTSALNDLATYATLIGETGWGHAWLLEVGATLIALSALLQGRRTLAWGTAAFAAPLLAVSAALSGHAAATEGWHGVALASDALHVLAASGWVGALFSLVVAGIPAALALGTVNGEVAVQRLVEAFSPAALWCATLLVVSGGLTAWIHLGSAAELWQSRFGQVLLLKLSLLAGVASTGAYNWRRVLPALGRVGGTQRLGRSARVELTFAVAVIALTTVLVATPTPMHAAPLDAAVARGHVNGPVAAASGDADRVK